MTSSHDTPGKHIAWGRNYSTALELLIATADDEAQDTLARMPKDMGMYSTSDLAQSIDDAIQVAIASERNRLIRWLEVSGYGVGAAALKAMLAEGQDESEPAPADQEAAPVMTFTILAPTPRRENVKLYTVKLLRQYGEMSLKEAVGIANEIEQTNRPFAVDLPVLSAFRAAEFIKKMAEFGWHVVQLGDAPPAPDQDNPFTVKVPT